jgi:DNA-binding NarL/FixJ family response regulator
MKILLADDHSIMREGLKALLSQHDGFEVVCEAENGAQAIEYAEEMHPDIVLMDITMPGLNGVEATKRLLSRLPEVSVIALSMHSDKRTVMDMIQAGVKGYILKDSAFREVIDALVKVYDGDVYFSPPLLHLVIDSIRNPFPRDSKVKLLSSREVEVLQLISEGHSTKEIASMLNVSTKTIESHRIQIMRKLDLHNIASLTKFAVREGITSI